MAVLADRAPHRDPRPLCRLVPALLGAAAILLAACAAPSSQLLSRATDPVTKPVISRPSPAPTATIIAPDCLSGALAARFAGGGFGTGNDFGEILIWNPAPQPCQLRGPVSFSAYYPDGSRDVDAVMNGPLPHESITLPPNMDAPQDGHDQSAYLVALMMGPERDDPRQPDGLCRRQDEGTPATLTLSIGAVRFRVANKDPSSVQLADIYGCYGQVLLEDIQGPQPS